MVERMNAKMNICVRSFILIVLTCKDAKSIFSTIYEWNQRVVEGFDLGL